MINFMIRKNVKQLHLSLTFCDRKDAFPRLNIPSDRRQSP